MNFIARVICWVFFTERMRRRKSRSVGIGGLCQQPWSLWGHVLSAASAAKHAAEKLLCHSERSEKSLFFLAFSAERFLAPLGMTTGIAFPANFEATPCKTSRSQKSSLRAGRGTGLEMLLEFTDRALQLGPRVVGNLLLLG